MRCVQHRTTGVKYACKSLYTNRMQAVLLDPTDSRLVSASSDCTFRFFGEDSPS